MPRHHPEIPPQTVLRGCYFIDQLLGAGGMGGVYLARHQELGNTYAVKETFLAQVGEYLDAFKREAQLLANLNHPNLPKVRDYFSETVEHQMPDGSKQRMSGYFLVMDYIEGKDLGEFLENRKQKTPPQGTPKPFELESVLDWADQLLDVLEYLHRQTPPIIHRDIKPPNLKLTLQGQLVLIDFGIAKGAVAEMTQIVAGKTIVGGSLYYSPIEQLLRIQDPGIQKPVAPLLSKEELNEIQRQYTDDRADLYAVGATLYELLTGNRPTPSVTRLGQILQGRPDPLRRLDEVNPSVPPKVAEAIAWTMAIKRQDRPSSATELRQALRAATPNAAAVEVKPVSCEPGAVLQNRYEVVRHLGAGGMGSVYEAKAQNLRGKSVALKRITFENTDPQYHARLIRMFEREADLLINLKHQALPTVYDFFSEGADYFLVMEYIAGDDLSVLLQRQGSPFALNRVLPWADQLLGILAYLHEQEPPILHRDIKPHNLKLNDKGEIILLDFGLARSAAGSQSKSGKSSSLGTPGYAPPEQYMSSGESTEPDVDARADVYAVGATLYHLLTGKMPADVTSRMGKIYFQQPDPLRPANEVNPQVPSAIAAAIQKAMELNREQRYASARQMRQQLRDTVETEKRAEEQRQQEALRLQQQEQIRRREELERRQREEEERKQQEEAQRQEAERQPYTETVNGVKIEMVAVQGGTFLMGSPKSETGRGSNEGPQHQVTVSSFAMGKYQVTQAQWKAVAQLPKVKNDLNADPSHFKGDNLPIEQVSWDDAGEFCERLSKATGKKYRLPAEAEWEYACRAGTTGAYAGNLDEMAWYDKNSGNKTHPVGTKQANAWGLYDMHGNVWEWCMDWYDEKYYSQSPSVDPVGPSHGSLRVFRGGGWFNNAAFPRSALRFGETPGIRNGVLGFRLLRTYN